MIKSWFLTEGKYLPLCSSYFPLGVSQLPGHNHHQLHASHHISSLEAELKASRKAWDAATAAKTTAEKSTKSALARAKKPEKALADANKERIRREQAVTERLNKISALARDEYHAFPFFVELPILILADVCFFSVFVSLVL
jgi:hypothetical protein